MIKPTRVFWYLIKTHYKLCDSSMQRIAARSTHPHNQQLSHKFVCKYYAVKFRKHQVLQNECSLVETVWLCRNGFFFALSNFDCFLVECIFSVVLKFNVSEGSNGGLRNCFWIDEEQTRNIDDINNLISSVTDVDVKTFITGHTEPNTTKALERDIRNVQRWMSVHGNKAWHLHGIPRDELNLHLGASQENWWGGLWTSSLKFIRNSIQSDLKDCDHQVSLEDRAFHTSKKALGTRTKTLQGEGKGN